MQLSRYVSCIKLKNNLYAIFNRLLFDPIFIDSNEKKLIFNNNFNDLSNNELKILRNKGIVISDENKDIEAFKSLYDYITNEIKNKISLVYIVGNNNCNMACKYCFIGKLNNTNPINMKKKTLENILCKFNEHITEKNLKKGIISVLWW